jgi:membrane associated rhomboid family serine protease
MSFTQRRVAQGGGMLAQLPPVVKAILILNVGIYFSDILFFEGAITNFGEFSIGSAISEKKIWEFITFQFMHGSLAHIFFNSMVFFFFGPFVERWLGSLKFIVFYLTCGVGGAAFFVLLTNLGVLPEQSMDTPLVGASAGIYGSIIAVAVLAPNMLVTLIFPPVTLSIRQLALLVIVVAVGTIIFEVGKNQGGEAGHLGGVIVGYILIRMAPLFGVDTKNAPKRPRRYFEPKIRPRTIVDLNAQSELDTILDKISREGFQSLTDEERDLLQHVANNKQD